MLGRIIGLARDGEHRFSKLPCESLRFIVGEGIEGDAHRGATVQHLSRVAKHPTVPNLRQVHLIQSELFDDLAGAGFTVGPGVLGENVTTFGIDLLALSRGTRLHLGDEVVLEVTGLRNPCAQIDDAIGKGGMEAVLDRSEDGSLIRKAGVMAIVTEGGEASVGDQIRVGAVPSEHFPLEPV